MAPPSRELLKKIEDLSKIKHKLNEWESHPRGTQGPKDYGGFMEGVEHAISKGWAITEKRAAVIERMYNAHILGDQSPALAKPVAGNESSFQLGEVGGIRSSEGWRIKINNIVVGGPINRESAYTIGTWLKDALESIKRLYLSENDRSNINITGDSDDF